MRGEMRSRSAIHVTPSSGRSKRPRSSRRCSRFWQMCYRRSGLPKSRRRLGRCRFCQPSPGGLALFFEFAALRYGQTADDVRLKFGPPDETTARNTLIHDSDFDSGFRASYDRQTMKIEFVGLQPEAIAAMKANGIKDDKFDYIGKHRGTILNEFRVPPSWIRTRISAIFRLVSELS